MMKCLRTVRGSGYGRPTAFVVGLRLQYFNCRNKEIDLRKNPLTPGVFRALCRAWIKRDISSSIERELNTINTKPTLYSQVKLM